MKGCEKIILIQSNQFELLQSHKILFIKQFKVVTPFADIVEPRSISFRNSSNLVLPIFYFTIQIHILSNNLRFQVFRLCHSGGLSENLAGIMSQVLFKQN